jgi:hypothetical protein
MKKNKDLLWNIFLVISFCPIIYLLIKSTVAAFTGCGGGLLNQVPLSGWDAFGETLVWGFLGFCIIPLIPTGVIYQIVYLVRWSKKHGKQEKFS